MITLLAIACGYVAVAVLVGVQAYHIASLEPRTAWWEGEADRFGAVIVAAVWPITLAVVVVHVVRYLCDWRRWRREHR